MYPSVTVAQPGRAALHLIITAPLEIGRECDGLLLADERISRRHFRISPSGSELLIEDLGSTNGTFIDGRRIEGSARLAMGMTAIAGDTTLKLRPAEATRPVATTAHDAGGTIVAKVADPKATVAGAAPVATPAASPTPSTAPVGSGAVVRPSPTHTDARKTSMDVIADSFDGSSPAIPAGTSDNTVTIMFSDIESSTELALSMGDQRWYQVLTAHNQLIEGRVAAHGGFIVKNQGDGFMVTFDSARRAIICSSEIQQGLRDQAAADPSNAIRVRIGLHTGEAIRQDSGDLFGRHVIIAARVGGLAEGGEILVSSIVEEIAGARGDLFFGEARMAELKGVGERPVYPVVWQSQLPHA